MSASWIGTSSGNWNTASDWSSGQVPGTPQDQGEDVTINVPDIEVITLDDPSVAYDLRSLTIGRSDNFTLEKESGFAGNVQMQITDSLGNEGQITISGTEANLTFEGGEGNVTEVDNFGEIDVSQGTIQIVATGAYFDGTGRIDLTGGAITGSGALGNADNTISGTGEISSAGGTLYLSNGGWIEASDGTLTLNTGATIENKGTIGANENSTLILDDDVDDEKPDGPYYSYIQAIGTGAEVVLAGNTVTGGKVETAAGGKIVVGNNSNLNYATLDNLNFYGEVDVGAGATLYLKDGIGTLSGDSNIDVSQNGFVAIDHQVTLLGPDSGIKLSGGAIVAVLAASGQGQDAQLNNDGTIDGYGTIGDGVLVLDNHLTIDADASGQTLTLALNDPSEATSFNEARATIEASAGGSVLIGNGMPGTSSFTNDGTLAAYAGSSVTLDQIDLTNFDGQGDLVSGTYKAAGQGATLELNQYFETLDARVILSGAGSTIEAPDQQGGPTQAIEAMLEHVEQDGELDVLGYRNFDSTSGVLDIYGVLQIGGGTVSADEISVGGTVAGFGALSSGDTMELNGNVNASQRTLKLSSSDMEAGSYVGKGTIELTGDSTIAKGTTVTVAKLLLSQADFHVDEALSDAKAFSEIASTIDLSLGTLTLSGATNLSGGSLTGAGPLALKGTTTLGTFEIANGAAVAITGKTTLNGALTLDSPGGTVGALAVESGGELVLGKTGSVVLASGGAGAIRLDQGGEVLLAGGSGDINGATGSLIAGGGTFASSIITAGEVSATTGALTLTGDDAFLGKLDGGSVILSGNTFEFDSGASLGMRALTLKSATLSLSTSPGLPPSIKSGSLFYPTAFSEGGSTFSFTQSGLEFQIGGAASLYGGSALGPGTLDLGGYTRVTSFSAQSGAVIEVDATTTASGTLTLGNAGGATSRIVIGSGGTLELDGSAKTALAAGGKGYVSIASGGTLQKASGTTSLVGVAVANGGTIDAASGLLEIAGAVNGNGSATIENGAALEFTRVVASTQAVSFGTGGGTLSIGDAKEFAGSIAGLGSGDTIDVAGLGAGTSYTYAGNINGGTLTLTHGSTVDKLTLVGFYTTSGFELTNGSSGDTLVNYVPPPQHAPAAQSEPPAHVAGLAQSLFDAAFAAGSLDVSASSNLARLDNPLAASCLLHGHA